VIIVRALSLATLLIGVVLLAVAWRDGRSDYQCGCSCDRAGNQIPPEEWFARTTADDDRSPLLIAAVLASVAATASALVGVFVFSGQRVFFASALGAGVAVGFASLLSIPELIPCLYY
jgi:hypothetical protein